MPKKTVTTPTVTKPKTTDVAPTPRVAAPRVKSAKHSKATVESLSESVTVNAHDRIAKIAYGYWAARGFQPGSPEQDWLRAEREYLLTA